MRGRVTYADSGQPVRRARVTLTDAESSSETRTTGTDRDGEFHVQNLKAGRYYAVVDSPGIISPHALMGAGESLPAAIKSGKVKDYFYEVSVDGTNSVRVEIRARRGGRIAGRVKYEDGEPLAGAHVTLFLRRGAELVPISLARISRGDARADSRGVYRVAGLPAGKYVIRVSEPSEETNLRHDEDGLYEDASFLLAYYPAAKSMKGAKAISVVEGEEVGDADIIFPERETYTVSGRVIARRGGAPLDKVQMDIEAVGEGPEEFAPSTRFWTGGAGTFSVSGIPSGVYSLNATRYPDDPEEVAEGERPRIFLNAEREVKVEGADVKDLTIRLSEGATVRGTLSIEGHRKPPARAQVFGILVEEENAQGVAITSAGVQEPDTMLTREDMPVSYDEGIEPASYMTEDYDARTGKFETRLLPPGVVHIYTQVPQNEKYYVKSITREVVDLIAAPLRIKDDETIEGVQVVLAPGAAILRGRLLLSPEGEAAGEGFYVVLIPADAARRRYHGATLSDETTSEGSFRISAPPGEYYVLTVRRSGDYLSVTEADVKSRGAKLPRITLRLSERRALDVTLQDEGTPRP